MGAFSPAHHADILAAAGVAAAVSAAVSARATGPGVAGRAAEPDDGIPDLATELYGRWYVAPSSPVRRAPEPSPAGSLPVGAVLRAVHPDAETWDPATVVQVGAAGTIAVRLDVRVDGGGVRALARGDHVPADPARLGRPAEVGDRVLVRRRAGGLVEEGFWRTWGARWSHARMPADLTRIYLAPRAGVAPRLVPALVRALEPLDAPWLVKAGALPGVLARPDGVVVYLPDQVAGLADGSARPVVGRVLDAARGLVAGPSPRLTAPLADGVGWSQDPGDGSSFGQHVCRVVASALEPVAGGLVPADESKVILRLAESAFRAAGLDPAAPHLVTRRRDAA